MEITEMPESRCSFNSQDADGELLMRQECPEIWRGKAESGKQKVEIGRPQMEITEMPESRCSFVSQGADGELLMPRECPEMDEGAGSRGGGVKAVEDNRSPSPGGLSDGPPFGAGAPGKAPCCTGSAFGGGKAEVRDQTSEVRDHREIGGQNAGAPVSGVAFFRHQRDGAGNTESPESQCSFILQDADGELVKAQESPEIRRGKAESGRQKVEIGRLQMEITEMPESGCSFVSQGADVEMLMRRECLEIGEEKRKAESRKLK